MMELLGIRGIIGVIIIVALSLPGILRVSRKSKIRLSTVTVLIYIIVNSLYYFSPQLLTSIGFLQESNHPKIMQLQKYFPDTQFREITSNEHNAVALGAWNNELIAITSKSLNEATLGGLIGVTYHELGHLKNYHMVLITLGALIVYYLLALFYSKVRGSRHLKISIALLFSIVRLSAYLWMFRMKEDHADIYAKESGNGLGLARYIERVIEDNEGHRGIGRKGFESLRYFHPPLEQRIKFLKDK